MDVMLLVVYLNPMAVRFYWTLVLIAGGSQQSDGTAVDEAKFMVERDAWIAGGVAGNNLDQRRSSPIFVRKKLR